MMLWLAGLLVCVPLADAFGQYNATYCLAKGQIDIDDYSCNCTRGYTGSHCQVNEVLTGILISSASISFICCTIQLCFRCKFHRQFSQWPNYIVYWRSVTDLMFSLHLIILNIWLQLNPEIVNCSLRRPQSDDPDVDISHLDKSVDWPNCLVGDRVFCIYFASVFQFTLIGSILWFWCGSYDYWRTISQPFVHPSTGKWNYTLWTLFISLTSTVFAVLPIYPEPFNNMYLYRANVQVCWTGQSQSGYVNPYNFLTTYIWLAVALFGSGYISLVGYLKMKSGGGLATLEKRLNAIENSRRQLIIFLLFWGLVAVLFGSLYQFTEIKILRNLPIPQFFAAVLPLNGCVNSVVWARSNWTEIKAAIRGNKKLSSFQKSHQLLAAMEEEERDSNDMSGALKKELLLKIASGMREALSPRPEWQALPKGEPHSLEKLFSDRAMKARKVVLNQGPESRCPKFFRYAAIDDAKDVEFIAHRPNAFQYLRESVYGISDEQYLKSFQSISPEALSGGKSGAFFFTTPDKKLVVKTLEPGTLFKTSELSVLLEILDQYCRHMTPRVFRRQSLQKGQFVGCCSLITKIFGAYTIKIYGQTIEFYVMEKLDPESPNLKVTERYDLKGSWVARLASKGSGTRKDQNFEGQTINLELKQAQEIFMQSVSDVHFFERNNIMDYSLLLAIHRCRDARIKDKHCTFHGCCHEVADKKAPANAPAIAVPLAETVLGEDGKAAVGVVAGTLDARTGHMEMDEYVRASRMLPVHKKFEGGMQSAFMEGPGVYFLGIIDPLQKWDFSKMVEGFIKRYIMCGGIGISAVPPPTFAARFLMMMMKHLAVSLSSIHSLSQEHRDQYGIQGVRLVNHRQTQKEGTFEYLVQLLRLEDDEMDVVRPRSTSLSRASVDVLSRHMNGVEGGVVACECWEHEEMVIGTEHGRALVQGYRQERSLGDVGTRAQPVDEKNFLQTLGDTLRGPVMGVGQLIGGLGDMAGISRLGSSYRGSTSGGKDDEEKGRSPGGQRRSLSSQSGSMSRPSTSMRSVTAGSYEPPRVPGFSSS